MEGWNVSSDLGLYRQNELICKNHAAERPGNFWTDFDDGELWNQDILMVQFFPDAVYAAAVVERDAAKDVAGGTLSGVASIFGR